MVQLEEHKHQTENCPLEKLPPPARVYLPMSQHIGKICAPLVNAQEPVLLGQKIAAATAHVYAPIHASVSGKVVSVQDWPHPVLGRCKAMVIENDGQDKSQIPNPKSQNEVENLSADQIRGIVFEAGIVGMGGASFPSYIKLKPPKPVDTLIINGAECEPYLTGDYRLMVEKTDQILKGVQIVARCLGVKEVYIAIEDNKPEAVEKFKIHPSASLGAGNSKFKIKVLKSAYPQGGEKQLVKNILKREVPTSKLPFDVGAVVHNVGTVFAIYEAVYSNKPLYERAVTVTGSCLSNPKNLLVRIGTPIKELIDCCGPLTEEPAKIITGGPMMGIAQYSDETPVIKSTTGVVLLNKKEAKSQEADFCIRCAACVRACPAGLMPCLINLASEKENWNQARALRAIDCIECGLCNYVCPAKIKLTQSIKRAKLEVSK